MMDNSEKVLLYKALAKDFKMFLEKCYYEIDGGEKYIETTASKLIIDKLESLTCCQIKRLIINVPPRTFKTTIVSIAYTAWLLGHNPKLKILCISYGDDLAKEFSIKTRQIMQTDWYKKTFPKTGLKRGRQQDDFFETTQNGFRKASSLGGTLTGYGADIIIIDDLQKAQEILSEKIRKSSNETFSNTIISRLNNKIEGKIIVVAQRLHLEDFSDYVQKYGQWDVLAIPAIAENNETYTLSDGRIIERKIDEVINPELEPLEKLSEIRTGMGEFNFSAQYQQNPIPTKGNIINFENFLFYDNSDISSEAVTFQSWDIALKDGKDNDYSVCITAKYYKNILYIENIQRFKLDMLPLVNKMSELHSQAKCNHLIVEESSVSMHLIQYLQKSINLYPILYKPQGDKISRANNASLVISLGRVLLKQNDFWLDDFRAEVNAFPNGKHDDQVDALSQLIDVTMNQYGSNNFIDLAKAMRNSVANNSEILTQRSLCEKAFNQHRIMDRFKFSL